LAFHQRDHFLQLSEYPNQDRFVLPQLAPIRVIGDRRENSLRRGELRA
jgi:hypothetical protein